jgi:mRNA interferase RelE/StbE
MASYRVVFKKSVAEDLRRNSKKDLAGILRCFRVLMDDPRPPGCEKLSDRERYRIRRGPSRIVYEIGEAELVAVVVKMERRREARRAI